MMRGKLYTTVNILKSKVRKLVAILPQHAEKNRFIGRLLKFPKTSNFGKGDIA